MNKQVLDWNKIQTFEDLKAVVLIQIAGTGGGMFSPPIRVRERRSGAERERAVSHLMVDK